MNKYPGWLYVLVLAILVGGLLMALPNIYGSAPAIQLSDAERQGMTGTRLAQIVQTVENAEVAPEAAYIKDGRVVFAVRLRWRPNYGRGTPASAL